MSGIGAWIVGVIVVLLALGGLFLASSTHDGSFYGIGLALFVFGVGFVFLLIKQTFDQKHRQ